MSAALSRQPLLGPAQPLVGVSVGPAYEQPTVNGRPLAVLLSYQAAPAAGPAHW